MLYIISSWNDTGSYVTNHNDNCRQPENVPVDNSCFALVRSVEYHLVVELYEFVYI